MKIETSGRWSDYVGTEWKRGRQAVTEGLRATGEGLKLDLRRQVAQALGHRAANMIGVETYPKGGKASFGAAVSVFARGDSAEKLLQAFSAETIIAPNGGKYLAIPTGFNKPGGGRRQGGNAAVSTKEMVSLKKWTYVRPTQDGRGLVWFLRVSEAQAKGKGGRVGSMAFAGGFKRVGGRRAGTEAALEAGAVPMFILLPMVTLKKRMDPAAIIQTWANRAPDLIARVKVGDGD